MCVVQLTHRAWGVPGSALIRSSLLLVPVGPDQTDPLSPFGARRPRPGARQALSCIPYVLPRMQALQQRLPDLPTSPYDGAAQACLWHPQQLGVAGQGMKVW